MLSKKIEHAEPDTSDIPEVDFSRAKVIRRGYGKPVRMSLRMLREAVGMTQDALAAKMNKNQAEISRLERRDDILLSTLKEYIGALGGQIEVVALFPGGKRITIAGPTRWEP